MCYRVSVTHHHDYKVEGANLIEVGMDTVDLEGANFIITFLDETSFYECNLRNVLTDEDSSRALYACYLSKTVMPGGNIVTNVIEE